MRKYLYIAAALLGFAMLPMVNAQAADNDGFKPYAGVGIGMFGLEFTNNSGTANFNQTVFGGYGKAGADIGDYFGLELRVGATAKGSETKTTATSTFKVNYLISYLAKAQYPVSPEFKVYALFGGTTAQLKSTDSTGFNDKPSKTGLSYGVGAEYRMQDSLSVGAEWMQYWTNIKLDPAPSKYGAGAKFKIWGAVGTLAYHF